MSYKIPRSEALEINESPSRLKSSFFKIKSMASHNLHDHWGVIWGNFQTLLGEVTTKDLLTETHWKIPRTFKLRKEQHGSHVFLLNIMSYPDLAKRQLMMEYCQNTPRIQEIQNKIKSYGMNQYYKSIPLKASIHVDRPTEIRIQTTHIPTYYQYEFGVQKFDENDVDIVVFTLHIPFMVTCPTGYPVIVVDVGVYLPKGIINHKSFHDSFYDYINRIFFYYQLLNITVNKEESTNYLNEQLLTFIDKIDEFIQLLYSKKQYHLQLQFIYEGHSFMERARYISSIISGYLRSYYTVCIPTSTDEINDISLLLDQFSSSTMMELHSNNLTVQINPFFTVQFVTTIESTDYFIFPFPLCLIVTKQLSVETMKEVNIISYYASRASYFINTIDKALKLENPFPQISPIELLLPLDHEFIIEDLVKRSIELIDKRKTLIAEYLFKEISILLMSKASILYNELLTLNIPFGKTIIEKMESCLDLQKADLQLIICMLKYEQPIIVAKFHEALTEALAEENQIKKNFF
ncbi:hypothetical protein EDI_165690 [Entamoeba dispar SAW760]|uniref:Uncharacterized protein n=1 Tax=Entamoeba dispar (strain ATCC PRA-260 / SAW760) TaxID=370354 RepID=B0EJI5_ENTDS|nr:uncharacterized protein EDI_165690 [Entamoeba dispar SAW760]EDR25307.1 hypothetical protein EDI_165690 [Entamoeba dispar SAW760]|eukprot:EDR25307.1 hypothetical protein EDI_165690 [Entamoeba dispar SAW760]